MYQPNFTISNKILKNIGTLEAAREVILNAPLVPAWEAKFREEAIIRTVHHGTHIEGNNLNYDEAARVVAGHQIVGRERDIQEILNYRNVLEFMEHFQNYQNEEEGLGAVDNLAMKEIIKKAQRRLNETVVLFMHQMITHRILTPGQSGEYRKIQVVVKNSETGEITFRPPPAIEVPFLVRGFLDFVRKTNAEELHPAIRAGITHYELVRIHPFIDGNGRTARAVALLVLFLDGYDIKKFFSLEEHYDKNPMEYYMALKKVEEDNGNLTHWLEYFTEGLAIELTRVKEKVLSLSRDAKLKENLGGHQFALSSRQIKIIEYVQTTGFLQNKMFFEILPMVSEDTVLRELKDLVDKGILKKEGSTKGARYTMV